jgi:hypothetical protein
MSLSSLSSVRSRLESKIERDQFSIELCAGGGFRRGELTLTKY